MLAIMYTGVCMAWGILAAMGKGQYTEHENAYGWGGETIVAGDGHPVCSWDLLGRMGLSVGFVQIPSTMLHIAAVPPSIKHDFKFCDSRVGDGLLDLCDLLNGRFIAKGSQDGCFVCLGSRCGSFCHRDDLLSRSRCKLSTNCTDQMVVVTTRQYNEHG